MYKKLFIPGPTHVREEIFECPDCSDDRAPRQRILGSAGVCHPQTAAAVIYKPAGLPVRQLLHWRDGRLDPPVQPETHFDHRLRRILQALARNRRGQRRPVRQT